MSGPGIPNYLDYPWRRRGLDHDRFAHRNLPQAKPTVWPGNGTSTMRPSPNTSRWPVIASVGIAWSHPAAR